MKLIRAHLPLFRILNSKFGIDCPASYLLFFVDLLLLSINTVTGELLALSGVVLGDPM